jgi:hypothetical protein
LKVGLAAVSRIAVAIGVARQTDELTRALGAGSPLAISGLLAVTAGRARLTGAAAAVYVRFGTVARAVGAARDRTQAGRANLAGAIGGLQAAQPGTTCAARFAAAIHVAFEPVLRAVRTGCILAKAPTAQPERAVRIDRAGLVQAAGRAFSATI